ncbi:MAG: hypothetical protein R2824_17730 [Saprospiraceae bacterium]|nr:hypothetical protein [Lewinella sp.]
MRHPDHFNLHEAIDAYLHEINQNALLNHEERAEIIDHLLTETEILQEQGLSERAAFTLAARQFGPSEQISREYQRVKPFFTVGKAAIAGSLLIFFTVFIVNLIYALSLGMAVIAGQFSLSPSATTSIDLALKITLIIGALRYVQWRFKYQSKFKAWEAIIIPFVGLLSPFMLEYCYSYNNSAYQDIVLKGLSNNSIILSILMFGGLVTCYRMIYQWRRFGRKILSGSASDTKVRTGIFVMLFLFLAIFSLTHIITSFSIWLATFNIFKLSWIKLFDFGLKLIFLGGVLTVIVSRIRTKAFFKKFELISIPLLGIVSPFLIDILFLTIASRIRINKTLFVMLNLNSQILLGLILIVIAITTYALLYRERKMFRTAS